MMQYNKAYKLKFALNAKLLAIIYLCYKYNFPLSYMIAFYELYGDKSLFVFKALACNKKIALNDSTFEKILNESRKLYKQILRGSYSRIERNNTIYYNKNSTKKKPVPNIEHINPDAFCDKYKEFIESYLRHITAHLGNNLRTQYDIAMQTVTTQIQKTVF